VFAVLKAANDAIPNPSRFIGKTAGRVNAWETVFDDKLY
jgi:hypothetical protein